MRDQTVQDVLEPGNDSAPANDIRPVIVADGVWKGYRTPHQQISLRHEAGRLLRRRRALAGERSEEPFGALKDVSFTIRPGESVGLVGRNGSGKTTLFRVLCGITRATRGRVEVHGRFGSLIALGAGFNPEQTGRANIYLNAAMHGINPRETDRLLPEILAFAELGDFIDAPVKRYSSGMVARLGFSVAVHILPDIVFIDEVLAVGDAPFQAKCIERLQAMKTEGRTLVFVSHAAEAVQLLCERSLWLHEGQLAVDGPTPEVLHHYLHMLQQDSGSVR